MYVVSVLNSEDVFSVVVNHMICCAFVQVCIIILCHFFMYTFHCNVAIKENLAKLWNRKKPVNSFDVTLLNIPECTYNYSQYQDGLVSDDSNNYFVYSCVQVLYVLAICLNWLSIYT